MFTKESKVRNLIVEIIEQKVYKLIHAILIMFSVFLISGYNYSGDSGLKLNRTIDLISFVLCCIFCVDMAF